MREALRCRVVGGVDCRVGDDSNIAPDTRKEKYAHMMRKEQYCNKKKEKREKKYMQEISTNSRHLYPTSYPGRIAPNDNILHLLITAVSPLSSLNSTSSAVKNCFNPCFFA